jgi:hypothetical protein
MHTQISLDGCIRGFDCPELYYVVAGGIDADMVLFGSNTVAMAFEQVPPETEADFAKPEILPGDVRPFGIIPDSRGRLRNLHAARNMGYLKDLIILVSETTPQEYLEYLTERHNDFIVAGTDHAGLPGLPGLEASNPPRSAGGPTLAVSSPSWTQSETLPYVLGGTAAVGASAAILGLVEVLFARS